MLMWLKGVATRIPSLRRRRMAPCKSNLKIHLKLIIGILQVTPREKSLHTLSLTGMPLWRLLLENFAQVQTIAVQELVMIQRAKMITVLTPLKKAQSIIYSLKKSLRSPNLRDLQIY